PLRPGHHPGWRVRHPELLADRWRRSEEHTSELQSRQYLVFRLLLEKNNRQALARCLHNLAYVVNAMGDYRRANGALHEATQIFAQVGDRIGVFFYVSHQPDLAHSFPTLRSSD